MDILTCRKKKFLYLFGRYVAIPKYPMERLLAVEIMFIWLGKGSLYLFL